MRCGSCGTENEPSRKFCGECGFALARRCGVCGAENAPAMKFCGECGAGLGDGPRKSESAAPTAGARDPRAYTPKHLADKILASKSALEGERKQVTVLFADVKGSMELADSVDPEQWHAILDRFFAILADGVHRFEGTVNQYTGDGIMALFGAPIAHEDHAQRACYAALYLREELRRYADELRLSRGLSFATRIGMNSGEVIVGKIGDDLRMDYTAQGHTVGLAQRMEQLAAPGSVLVAGSTARLTRDYFELRDLGPAAIRGAAEPVPVFELVGAGALRTRFDVSRARGLSRFVGRSNEMTTLEAALERAIAGQGGVVGIVAVAGTGKSRLCFELTERCRARGILVRSAHGVSHGMQVPFLPVLELLRGFFDVSERDAPQAARNKIAGAALLLDRALEGELPLLFDLLGVSDPERPSGVIEADERSRRLLGVVRRLIEARSRREPLVILIEDLHWIDASTEAFVASAVEATARTRTLLLLNFRPEYHAPWMARAHYQQIPLMPLGPEGVRELARELLGPDPSVAVLTERILARTAGNPFFIEEIVRGLEESGALAGTRGAHRLVGAVDALELPASVQALLAARIDRLAEREKRVLSAASVIGLRFEESLLSAAVELPDAELAEALRSLVSAELIYEEALYPQRELAFAHPLTQEVAYRTQLSQSRARLHRAVAGALVAVHAGTLEEHAALISHHYEQAGDALAAAVFADRAAEWSVARGPDEARRQWQRVRTLLASVEPSPETRRLRLRALVGVGESGFGLSMVEGLEVFEQGRMLADELRDPVSLTRLRAGYGRLLSFQGKTAEAIEWASAAVRDADQTTDLRLRVMTRANLSILLGNRGQIRAALAMNEEARERQVELVEADESSGSRVLGFVRSLAWYHGTLLSRAGRLDEASAVLERALADEQALDPFVMSLYQSGLAQVAWFRAEAEEVFSRTSRAMEVLELGSGSPEVGFVGVSVWLGVAHSMRGAFNEAEGPIEHALAVWRENRASYWQALALSRLAEVKLGQGDHARAIADADEAVALAREGSFEIWLGDALLVRARVRRVADGIAGRDEIERELAEVEVLLERTGARSYAPRLHLERAELARLLGDKPRWRQELREAQAVYREIGAPRQAERLEKELAQ